MGAGDNAGSRATWTTRDYDLGGTLDSGQAFGWERAGGGWEGVVDGRWVWLAMDGDTLEARTAEPVADWGWIERYLGLHEDLGAMLATFPDDPPLHEAVASCRGLRLLRQAPWEALACFLCSATKQIVQIREIVRLLRDRHGEAVPGPDGRRARAFPTADRLALLDEDALRACKLGFRAPNLLAAARAVSEGRLSLDEVRRMPLDEARAALMTLRGVGRKVADCALLFGLGFDQAFPVDVWVRAALTRLYFPRGRRPSARRLEHLSATHFGPHAGLAQQYLFHHVRTRLGRAWAKAGRGKGGVRKRAGGRSPNKQR